MPVLNSKLRSDLDCVCQKARDLAEAAARSALQKRAVDAAEPFRHFSADERDLRNRLRARGRQLGDVRNANKTQGIDQLTQELAYEYWHRMLFARFLAENHLLMHPDGVAVSLAECDELAAALPSPGTPGEGQGVRAAANGFVLAARYASKMLPQIFRTDDVLLEIEFPANDRLPLEKLVNGLPAEVFCADDSLGWVYQFWQSKKKDEVNKSGEKIDGRTLPAVTQLFTEHYMVQFLLHNTLGAWWCARHKIKGPPDGAGVPAGRAPVEMEYFRWRDDGTPAAGTFDGWPKTLKEFKLLDPCCGSGHFLVAAFSLLVPLRMHDEGLSARSACDAVLRENLFGLELDPRCTQIAAFALALAAWKYPGDDEHPLGFRQLPPLNIACTGIGPQATETEWLKLAEQSGRPMSVLSREPILNGLRNLYSLFSNAPTLGSLIDPNQLPADLISADYETLQPYLAAALTAEQDDDAHERAVAAAGMARAAELLAGEYALIATNVPYLARGRQCQTLCEYIDQNLSLGKHDIATTFLERFASLVCAGGVVGIVSPQGWLFMPRYKRFRVAFLEKWQVLLLGILGEGGFVSSQAAGAFISLGIFGAGSPTLEHTFSGLDVSDEDCAKGKDQALRCSVVNAVNQLKQLENPDARVVLAARCSGELLSAYAESRYGLRTADKERFVRYFPELPTLGSEWRFHQSSVDNTENFGGRECVLLWERGAGQLAEFASLGLASIQGEDAWGKNGVVVSLMRSLPVTMYTGESFDNNCAIVWPKSTEKLSAIWHFCKSEDFNQAVREIDQSLKVMNATLLKVRFDLAYWQAIAEEQQNGLPEPESDDPTQWLFHGRPERSTAPLQVAAARLLGYQWPPELDPTMRLSTQAKELVHRCDELLRFADDDGIVCIPGVRAELPAAERLLEVLQVAYGPEWSNSLLHDLLTEADCKPGTTLDDWLRNAFFEQHCKLFHNRPFIWHIWDGRKDGFACMVNYHKLTNKALENLAYSYLGDWIKAQSAEAKAGKAGADLRLAAAQALQEKLKLILIGEPPYDIFVRWKPLHEQPIGWNPDLNDGVRVNIRPFVEAGILRKNPNIKWTKDRGKEPERDREQFPWFWKGNQFVGERVNDVHLTNTEKQKGRSGFPA